MSMIRICDLKNAGATNERADHEARQNEKFLLKKYEKEE